MASTRTLILSWEYPPLIEGGLARHVRKLSEALVGRDVEVHVLTRGGEESPAEETVGGVAMYADNNVMTREEALRLYTQGSSWFSSATSGAVIENAVRSLPAPRIWAASS